MSYKDKVENLLKTHLMEVHEYQEEVRSLLKEAVLKSKKWKEEALKEEVNGQLNNLKEQFEAEEVTLNNMLKSIVDDVKAEFDLDGETEKTPDYAAKVANANEYLKLEGKDITDDQAYLILKDFIDDMDQMQLFKRLMEHQGVEFVDALGNSNFPKTFGKLHKHLEIINTINELEGLAENTFLNSTAPSGESFIFYNTVFNVPTRTYHMQSAPDVLLGLAEDVDNLILKRDTPSEQGLR